MIFTKIKQDKTKSHKYNETSNVLNNIAEAFKKIIDERFIDKIHIDLMYEIMVYLDSEIGGQRY